MMADGGVEFYIEGGDNDVNPEAAAVNDDAWHHITATWDINADAKLYVDGSTPVSVPHTANEFALSGTIRLGQPASRQRFYTGLIDDVRVYDKTLSTEEIQELYQAGLAELSFLEIVGPDEVAESSMSQYKAIAHYDNNSTRDVTDSADIGNLSPT